MKKFEKILGAAGCHFLPNTVKNLLQPISSAQSSDL
jgi:hypothetical protein